MRGHTAVAGLCLLCALAFSAVGVQRADAATKGTTLFTCKKKPVEGGAGFSQEHCKKADAVSTGAKFEHVAVAENTTTEITGTNTDTAGKPVTEKLVSVQSGIEEEIQSEVVHILPENSKGEKSWITNAKDPVTGEHYYHGEQFVKTTNVIISRPAEKGCVVKGGEITSNKLKFTSKGQGENVLFEPTAGTVFAEFTIEGCTIAALNGLYKIEGKFKAQADGATFLTTIPNTKAEGTLKLRGQVLSKETVITLRGTDKPAGDVVDTPLSPTTVETP